MATSHQPSASVQTPFTDAEVRPLEAVRVRFQQDHDVLSARERKYWCFLRWLVQIGRIVP